MKADVVELRLFFCVMLCMRMKTAKQHRMTALLYNTTQHGDQHRNTAADGIRIREVKFAPCVVHDEGKILEFPVELVATPVQNIGQWL